MGASGPDLLHHFQRRRAAATAAAVASLSNTLFDFGFIGRRNQQTACYGSVLCDDLQVAWPAPTLPYTLRLSRSSC